MKAMLRAAALAGVVMFAAAGDAASAACREDLVATSQTLKRTREAMESAAGGTEAAKCAAYRRHVTSLKQVRAVFARCDTGADKAKNDAQVGASIAEVNRQSQQACKK